MTRISVAQDVAILQLTVIICSIMVGLTMAPWVDKLRHLDVWQRKKRPGDGDPTKAHGKKIASLVWHKKGEKSNGE